MKVDRICVRILEACAKRAHRGSVALAQHAPALRSLCPSSMVCAGAVSLHLASQKLAARVLEFVRLPLATSLLTTYPLYLPCQLCGVKPDPLLRLAPPMTLVGEHLVMLMREAQARKDTGEIAIRCGQGPGAPWAVVWENAGTTHVGIPWSKRDPECRIGLESEAGCVI